MVYDSWKAEQNTEEAANILSTYLIHAGVTPSSDFYVKIRCIIDLTVQAAIEEINHLTSSD